MTAPELAWYVAVVGPSQASEAESAAAEEIGRLLAERHAVLVCGGLGGVMEAASRGADRAGGYVLGLLPGIDRGDANPYVTMAVATGLGEMRNALIVRAADAVIAIGGSHGTLSEIAFALRTDTPVVGLGSWDVPGVVVVEGPEAAVEQALTARTNRSEDRP